MLSLDVIRDKALGCFVGSAVGDALGMPSEGMSKTEIREKFGNITDYSESQSCFSRGLQRGQWTDDTALFKATLDGFFDALLSPVLNWNDLSPLQTKVLHRYLEAVKDHTRGFGKTTRESLKDRLEGLDPHDGRHQKRPGNGCAMKGAAVGLVMWLFEKLRGVAPGDQIFDELALSIGILTHGDSRSLTAGLLQGLAAYEALEGMDLRSMAFANLLRRRLHKWEQFLAPLDGPPNLSDVLPWVWMFSEQDEEFIADIIKTSGAAYESFPTALCFAIKYQDDFRSAVLAGANAGGDTDTIACMSGALVGARVGLTGVPEEWQRGLEKYDELVETVDRLITVIQTVTIVL